LRKAEKWRYEMKSIRRRASRLKRAVAWLLTAAIITGNVSQLGAMTSFGAENTVHKAASPSSADLATPSEATPSEARRVIDVKVTQSAILKVLKKDSDRRPEFNEDQVPFEGEQKDLVIQKIYEELEGKTLVLQKKVGKAMYLVVVSDTLGGDPFSDFDPSDRISQEAALKSVQIIGINGYKDRECQFRLNITGEDIAITDASVSEFAVVGENEPVEAGLEPTIPGGGANSSVSGGTNGSQTVTGENGQVQNGETKSNEPTGNETTGNETTGNETTGNETTGNETTGNETIDNETISNESSNNGTSNNNTSNNETSNNDTSSNNASNNETKSNEIKGADTKGAETDSNKSSNGGTGIKEESGNKDTPNSDDKSNVNKDSKSEHGSDSEKALSISISKHKVPILFEAEPKIATASQAEADPMVFDAADIISLGERSLSDEERESLMGVNEDTSLFSFLNQTSFDLVVKSFGISTLSSAINSEVKLSPYETALTYYGPDAEDKKDVVELHLTQSQTGPIKAGILYSYTLTYAMQTSPLYEYAAGGKLSLFDLYEDARIEFKVPEGIHLEEKAGKVKFISNGNGQNVYEIHVGNENNEIQPGKLDSITVNAWIDGNGERAVGEQFTLPDDSVAFYAKVKVADKTNKDDVTYPGSIETMTYGEQPSDTALKLVSDDSWHIKKRVYPNDNSYVVSKDDKGVPQYVDITYLIEVGMKGSSGDISRQPAGTIYQTYGRTGFEKDSFKITDSLTVKTAGASGEMKPISVTAVWADGSNLDTKKNEDGSVTFREYKTQGQNSGDHIYVSDQAPTYSSYLVTARYPYEPFLLKYNDSRVSDASVFTISNNAHLEYAKLGTGTLVSEDSFADIKIHEVNRPAVIRIKKQIDEGVGTIKDYGLSMEKEYPGMAGFQIFSLDGSGKETPYENYTVIDQNGKKIDSRIIAVNPSKESGEEGSYTTADRGYIEIQVDPGNYVIREEKTPAGTAFASAKVGSKSSTTENNIKVALKEGESETVTVMNGVIGKGSVEFYKKAQLWNNGYVGQPILTALEGAEFSLLEKKSDGSLSEAKTVKSGSDGLVQFKPISPGDYVVREKSANGYILDTKDYPVTVKAGEISHLVQGDNMVINTLNEGRLNVTKLVQGDSGTYIPVPSSLRGDFNDRFWIEQSTNGSSWTKVSVGSKTSYSLDGNSQFNVLLPVMGKDGIKINYRLVEFVPDGYSDGNRPEDGFKQEIISNKTYLYKEFTLSPLNTNELEVKNNKGGTLKLNKTVWAINTNGTLNKSASKQNCSFKLYSSDKNGGVLTEVSNGLVYKTDSNGAITVKGLDVTKKYYWYEVNTDARLESEDPDKMMEANINGVSQPVIGPYEVRREQENSVNAYNVPQKVPYWFYKYDITNTKASISAKFKITRQDNGQQVYAGAITQSGKFISLDPGTTYVVEETEAPKNFVKEETSAITTPNGPVTRKMLEEWFSSSKPLKKIVYNKPFKEVTIKKILHQADGTDTSNISAPFEVYTKDGSGFHQIALPSGSNTLVSNQSQPIAPGTYYFKENVPSNIINPKFLLKEQGDGVFPGYEIMGSQVYYGPFIITAAITSGEKKMDLNFNQGSKPFENYQNLGRVKVIKKNALKDTTVQGAVLGIFNKQDFNENDWENSIKKAIQQKTSDSNGQVLFDSSALKIFDDNGNRISYVIAEITPPSGYLQSYEVLTTYLKEGTIITTENGTAGGKNLIIKNEPKLTIRTQKYWQDGWNDQFYQINRVLGNVKLALYKVNAANPELADYVKTETTNSYDGVATFQDINRNDTYFVAEVRVPDRQETGLSFDLNMGEKKPLPLENGEPSKTLPVKDLESRYNAIKYTGKNLNQTADSLVQNTNPLYNYRSWVQFNVLKICAGVLPNGTTHGPEKVNGAKFTLFKMLDDNKSLSSIQLKDLEDKNRFEAVDHYESGTRIDPKTGARADGEFDTSILEAGKVYWLVENEPAVGYVLPNGPQIVAVFVPKAGDYKGWESIRHPYENGRNNRIAEIKNTHGEGPGGLARYHFQIALNKWLKDETSGAQPTLLGGAKFQIWLLDPVTKEKLIAVDVIETGLESDGTYKTGYGLSKIINFDDLKQKLEEKNLYREDLFKLNEEKHQLQAEFALEEIYAPSKVRLDPTLHQLSVTVDKDKDTIDTQYFWDKTKDAAHRLMNILSSEYPVTLVKYGYVPDLNTFGKTDDALDGLNITRTPLSGVTLELWKYQWKDTGYEYIKAQTYTTTSDGRVVIPGGLSSGHYRIREILPDHLAKTYLTMYNGQVGLYRYFTVGSSPLTVNVYNPERPNLEIEKTTWNGEKPDGLKGIGFTIKRDTGSTLNATVVKTEDGRYVARFSGLESGPYTLLKEDLSTDATKLVTDGYFESQRVAVGYSPKADGEKVALWPENAIVTGNLSTLTVKNPRLSELLIYKKDGETNQSDASLKGASFKVEYMKFRAGIDYAQGQLADVEDPGYKKPEQGFALANGKLLDQGDGSYALKDCPPGWYRITEEKAPEGYTKDTRPVIVAVTGDMGPAYKDTTISIDNRKKVELTITKNLEFGEGFQKDDKLEEKLPAQIVFDVYTYGNNAYQPVLDENGTPVQVKINQFIAKDGHYTGSKSVLLPQNPEGGAYYLKEQEQADWVLSSDNGVENGTLFADGYFQAGGAADFTSKAPVSVTVKNRYAKAKVVLTKVKSEDSTKKLTGGVFQLYSDPEFNNKVGDFTEIGQSGSYEIVFSTKQHHDGQYYIKEVSAPAGYISIKTAFPEGGLLAETGKTTEVTMPNKSGVDLWVTKYSGNGTGEALKPGITFELYKKSSSGTWTYVSQGLTDSNGKVSFLGLSIEPLEAYAVKEVEEKDQGFLKYRMDSFGGEKGTIKPVITDVSKDGGIISGQELYVLADENTILPGVYEFKAHNQEALPLKIFKNDINRQDNPDASIKATIKVTDKKTGNQVGDVIPVAYGETGTTIQLLPGTYEIEETQVLENQNGYIINRDDERTVYKKEVTIEKGTIPGSLEFTNVKQKTDVTLEKTSLTASLKDLWWNDGQTATYTLTPHVTNTIPLDGFVIRDLGLTMLDSGKNVLPDSEYTNEKYTITSIKPGKSTEQNRIRGGKTGTIMADVTFYDFKGTQVGGVQSVKVSGDGEIGLIRPVSGKNVKSFQISYRDDTLKNSTEHKYILGQDFTPGSVEVGVKLFRQDAKLSSGSYKEEIKYINNQADATISYREWDSKGTLGQEIKTKMQASFVNIPIVQSKAPVITAEKNVTPMKEVQANDMLNYTLTVKNVTKSNDPDIVPMRKPVLIDHIPEGVTVSGEVDGEDRILKAVSIVKGPQGVGIEKTVKKVDALTGQETLFIVLSGELKQNEQVTVGVQAKVAGNIVSYGKNILNKLYVTSDVLQPAFSLNKTGASFMVETNSGDQWPSADLPSGVLLPEEKYRSYGYVSDSAENFMSTGTGLRLFKEVKGNLDTRFVSGTTAGRTAKTIDGDGDTSYDGSVLYRLTINNDSSTNYVSSLQLMDILPTKGDLNADSNDRLSDYRIRFENIQSISIENKKDDSDPGRKVEDFNYQMSYSNQAFDNKNTVKAAKNGVLSDNGNGFWSGSGSNPSAFRLKITDKDFYLAPGENLVIVYKTTVPYNTSKELEEVAYGYAVNDFALTYSYREGGKNGNEKPTGQMQNSNSTQVLLVPGDVKVSGRIFIDEINRGIQHTEPSRDHLLTDLLPVLSSGYFNVSLIKYGKNGDDEVVGAAGPDARFTFGGLTPAKPFGITGTQFTQDEENSWYVNQALNVSKLKGDDPAHYRIRVTTGQMPVGYEDLVLKLTKPFMMADGENKEAGRSRTPATLRDGGRNQTESADSNFKEGKTGYVSEDFFLWSTSGEYDTTKDIGFVPYRNVKVKKTDSLGNPVKGVHFSIYGPYTNEELETLQNSAITDTKVLGAPAAEGSTTLEDGEAVFQAGDLFYYRNYIVVEDQSPEGFEMDNAQSTEMELMKSFKVKEQKAWVLKSKEFKTEEDKIPSIVTVKNAYKMGSLTFKKVDEATGNGLPGAAFLLKAQSDVPELAWKAFTADVIGNQKSMGVAKAEETDQGMEFETLTGDVTLTGIPYGSYTLSEIRVPEGYDITKKQGDLDFKVSDDGQKVTLPGISGNIITNTRAGYLLTLRKTDSSGNKQVKGISFAIEGPGTYEGKSWVPFSKERLVLKDADNTGYEVKETDDEGLITWNLPYGDYKIKELPSDGYQSIEPFFVRVAAGGNVSLLGSDQRKELTLESSQQKEINISVENTVKTATLAIEKRDGESHKPITGAEFELSGTSLIEGAFKAYQEHITGLGVSGVTSGEEDGTLFIRFKVTGTETNKIGTLTQIPYGSYTLKEIKAPEGYILEPGKEWRKEFKLESPEGLILTGNQGVDNEPHVLIIEKQDEITKKLLIGAEFTLVTQDGNYVSLNDTLSYLGVKNQEDETTRFVIGPDGKATIKRLPAGEYILKEIKAPENYSLTGDTKITILSSGNRDAVVVYDVRSEAKIRLIKTSAHDHEKKLAGAEFEIYSDQDLVTKKGTITTGTDGAGESEMLPLGTYYIKETKAPTGFERSDNVYQVTLKNDSDVETVQADGNDFITNRYGTGALIFDKTDKETGEKLKEARFSVTEKKSQVEGAWNDFSSNLKNMSQDDLQNMGMDDLAIEEGKILFTAVNGHISLKGIPYGSYTLKEEMAPTGYLSLSGKAVIDFTLTEDQKEADLGNNNVIVNERAQYEIQVRKTDNLGRSISGMQFRILGPGKYEDGGLLSLFGSERFHAEDDSGTGLFTTGEDGIIKLGLKHGDYQLKEIATDRYDSLEPFYIRVNKDGTITVLKNPDGKVSVPDDQPTELLVTNQISTGRIELEKVDAEEKVIRLNGAEFTLTNLETLVPGAWDSYRSLAAAQGASWDLNQVKGTTITFALQGKGAIENLPYGTYRLTETKAPDGYILGTQPWTREFTLGSTKKEVLYTTSGLLTKTEGPVENMPSAITVLKTNAIFADLRLKGAEFLLKASDGRYVMMYQGSFAGYTPDKSVAGTIVTGDDGQFIIKRLPKDTYTFIETKAPSGYYINNNIPPVTLDGVNRFTISIQDARISTGGDRDDGGSGGGRPTSPTVTIVPDPVPLANLPADQSVELLQVDDGNVPLARLPKTGERKNNAGKVMVTLSGFMLALYAALTKKNKEKENN
jgi:uncharacterized surface anchored protein